MELNFSQILLLVVSPLALLGVISFLLKNWILERLKASIKNEYDQLLEDYKYQFEVRKKAESVASLLSQWASTGNGMTEEERKELNKLTFECFLWLPDDLAKDLSDLLAWQRKDQVSMRSVILKVRNHLLNKTELQEQDVIIFTKNGGFINGEVTTGEKERVNFSLD